MGAPLSGRMLFPLLIVLGAFDFAHARGGLNVDLYKRQGGKSVAESVTFDGGFWFTNLTVGGQEAPLELLVDSGSADLVLNPGRYKPGRDSVNLNESFEVSYGTTEGDEPGSSGVTIKGNLHNDTVSWGSLTLKSQTIGVIDESDGNETYPRDGIIGLGGALLSGTNSTTFFHNICGQELIPECRFGIGLGLDGTGTLTLGALDKKAIGGGEEKLVRAPIIEEWYVTGDVAVDDKVLQKGVPIGLDSGSAGIVGPIKGVTALFGELGIESVLSPDNVTLVGYFPCDKPPAVGFSIPSQKNASEEVSPKVFNIPARNMAMGEAEDGGNNCTSIISGQDFPEVPGLWVVGQAFFQGKYIDHSLVDGTVGFAQLASNGDGSPTSPTAPTSTPPDSGASSLVPQILSYWKVVGIMAMALWVV